MEQSNNTTSQEARDQSQTHKAENGETIIELKTVPTQQTVLEENGPQEAWRVQYPEREMLKFEGSSLSNEDQGR